MKKSIYAVMLVLALAVTAWGVLPDGKFSLLCKNGSAQQVRAALLQGANPNDKSKDGFFYPALTYASIYNTPEVVSLLLKAGADANGWGFDGMTALIGAAKDNPNTEVLSLLLKAGANVNQADEYGRTALMKAALSNPNPQAVSVLLKAGAGVNLKDRNGMTALFFAAANKKHPEVISALLKAGANIGVKDNNGMTALDWAQKEKNDGAVKLLKASLESGVAKGDPEALYQRGLQYATGEGMPLDQKKGIELLRQAAAKGHKKAKEALKLLQ